MEKIKIVAIVKPKSGSHYWRLKYPLSKINGSIVEDKEIEITFVEKVEDILDTIEQYNILAYHWDIKLTLQELGRLQSKGVKLWYSIDDDFIFSERHPDYGNNVFSRQYVANRVKQHIINADCVVVSTNALALKISQYNDKVAILYNFANPEEFNQFKEKTPSDKLRIGICGSRSHYPDYMILKQVINKLSKNKEIAEKCEFHICGVVKDDKYWDEVISLFTVKKNLKVLVKEFLPLEEYLNLYKDLDISLLPLEYTPFNLCKSSLKIWENMVTNTLPIGSSLYSGKELSGIVVCEKPEEYEKTILELLDKNKYNQVLEYIHKANSEDNKWELRLEHTKAVINTLYSEDLSLKLDDVKIFGVCYEKEQETEYEKYDNSGIRTLEQNSQRFEYNAAQDICSNKLNDFEGYVGILSHKFSTKTGYTKNILYRTLKLKKYQDYDFINLTKNYWENTSKYLDFSEQSHPGLLEKLKEVCEIVGLNYTDFRNSSAFTNVITYSNFFLMKKELYCDYIGNYVIPAMQYMESNPERFMVDAGYKTGVEPEKLKELTGLPYYTFLTFIAERMILFYIQDKKLKTLNLQ